MSPLSPDPAVARRAHSPTIELELRQVDLLFNPIDPSPLEDRDLSPEVEEFIVSWAEEYPPDAALRLCVHSSSIGRRKIRRIWYALRSTTTSAIARTSTIPIFGG